ncbi:MAG: class I adenylate-forming enzyme family protein [Planctomycetota bacterium]
MELLPNTEQGLGFIDRFLLSAKRYPENIAILIDETDEEITYAELKERMERFKGAFEALGVSRGERVALMLPTCIDFVACFYALASMEATALFLSPRHTAYELERILNDARPARCITCAEYAAADQETFRREGSVRSLLLTDKEKIETAHFGIESIWLDDYQNEKSALTPPAADALVTCHYTYKGLGYPVGVLHQYQDYTYDLEGWERRYVLGPDASSLAAVPIYPILGTVLLVMSPLCQGSRAVFVGNIMHMFKTGVIHLFERRQIKCTTIIPTLVRKMLKEAIERGPDAEFDFHPQAGISCGGDYLDAETVRRVRDIMGIEIYQGYGATEALIISVIPDGVRKAGSIGTVFARGTRVYILDPDGDEVQPGRTGEIVVAGSIVAHSYLDKPDISQRFLKNQVFPTGDLGYMDDDGHIFFTGRFLPFTKISAQMVDLLEINKVFDMHPAVEDTLSEVVGQDGSNHVSSLVTIHRDEETTREELRAHCSEFLSKFKVPAKIRILKQERPLA